MSMIDSHRKTTDALIELESISKVYGTGSAAMHALRGIDLRIAPGEFVAVMGHSGSGKSTCMNILGCLDPPTAGSYRSKGVKVETLSRDQRAVLRRHYLGFVFQGFNLLKRTSALENVELPLVYRGIPVARRRAQARQALDDVGLTGCASHTSGELSGVQLDIQEDLFFKMLHASIAQDSGDAQGAYKVVIRAAAALEERQPFEISKPVFCRQIISFANYETWDAGKVTDEGSR